MLGKACAFRWERSELADSNRSCSKVAVDNAISAADRSPAGWESPWVEVAPQTHLLGESRGRPLALRFGGMTLNMQ